MSGGGILVTNERLARLDRLAHIAVGRRDFAVAEQLFLEKLATLQEFRYVDDLEIAKALNMLAFVQECQLKFEQATKHRLNYLAICAEDKLKITPVIRTELPPKQSVQPGLRQQMRVIKSA